MCNNPTGRGQVCLHRDPCDPSIYRGPEEDNLSQQGGPERGRRPLQVHHNRKKKSFYTTAKLWPIEDTSSAGYGWQMLPLIEAGRNLPKDTEEIRKELFMKLRNVWHSGATRSSTRTFYPFQSMEEEASDLPAWPAENRPRNRWPEYEARRTGNQGKKPHFLTCKLKRVDNLKNSPVGGFSPKLGFWGVRGELGNNLTKTVN